MHLIHLTYQTSQLSSAHLNTCSWRFPLSTVGQSLPMHSLFYNGVLTTSCNLWNTVLKLKNNVWLGAEWRWVYCLLTVTIVWLTRSCATPAQHRRKGSSMLFTSPRKDPNAKSKGWFLQNQNAWSLSHHCKFKKSFKSNHYKSGWSVQ